MDTDDLSIPTYTGVIIETEKFNHDLTLQFGLLALDCKDDNDYLNQAEALIKKWLNEDDLFNLVEDIFFGESVNEKEFKKTLNKLLSNIAEIRKTPMPSPKTLA
jgi:type I restriction-modification system DNA methylase subunit